MSQKVQRILFVCLGNICRSPLAEALFQSEIEARNLVNYGSVRTYGGNKFVIEFDYHQMPELTNADWKPEPKPASKYII